MLKLVILLSIILSLITACSSNDSSSTKKPKATLAENTVGGGTKSATDAKGFCKQEVGDDFQSYRNRLNYILPELQIILTSLSSSPSYSESEDLKLRAIKVSNKVAAICDEMIQEWGVFICKSPTNGEQVSSQEMVDNCQSLEEKIKDLY